MDTELVERTVVTDIYTWMTPIPGRLVGQHNVAYRGDVIKISLDEAIRGGRAGGLGTGADAAAAAARSSEPPAWGDDQVNSASAVDIIAYLGQHPSEAERIRDLEAGRRRPRSSVAEAVERIIAARDEAIADAAARHADAAAADAEATPGDPAAEAEAMRAIGGGAPVVPSSAK